MNSCGNKPTRLAIGIAPLGIISIGIVPMGVVSIGVLSLGVVGMGVVVAGLNAMGIWSFGPGTSHQHHSSRAPQEQLMAYQSKQVALEKAGQLGCKGVHAVGSMWMPCSEHSTQHPTHQH